MPSPAACVILTAMSDRIKRAAPWLALAASFSIYLMPLAGPHLALPLGQALLASLFESSSDQPLLWTLANFAVALAVQAAAWALFFMLFRRPGWLSGIAVILAAPVLFGVIQFAYFLAIPIVFLIEAENAVEQGQWAVACTVDEGSMSLQRRTALGTLEQAGEAWVRLGKDRRQARLTMPGCRIDTGRLQDSNAQIDRASPSGGLLYRSLVRSSGKYEHWYVPPGGGAEIALQAPEDEKYWAPTLSSDGRWVAWLRYIRDDRKATKEVRITRLEPAAGKSKEIVANLPLPASFRLQTFDAESGTFIVVRNSREVFGLGMDGQSVWGPVTFPGFDHLWDNFRLVGDGWVAWDSYRENERYRVAWSLPQGTGRIEIPRGRGINDVSVQPAGGLIAVGLSGNLRIGTVKDSVFVLRTDTGKEVYRRFMPSYSRPHLAFLGRGHLAIGRYADGRSWIEVLAVPSAFQQPRE